MRAPEPTTTQPQLYTTLADWWPLLSAPEVYAAEAQRYTKLLSSRAGTLMPSSGGSPDGGLEWSWDPDPSDTTHRTDFAILMREADGETCLVHDRHLQGLFSRAEWARLCNEAGLTPSFHVLERDDSLEAGSEVILCRKSG